MKNKSGNMRKNKNGKNDISRAETIPRSGAENISWFDPFTRWMLVIMFALLFMIFAVSKYMDVHKMTGGGTDDTVNAMASRVARVKAHPFVNLPGDAQVGAFSVANFFAGMIVGHNWKKLFGREDKRVEREKEKK